MRMSVEGGAGDNSRPRLASLRAPQHSLARSWDWHLVEGMRSAMCPRRSSRISTATCRGKAWDLLDMRPLSRPNWHCFGPSRVPGVPRPRFRPAWDASFTCSFCINAPFTTPMLRVTGPDNVIGQIDRLVREVRRLEISRFRINVRLEPPPVSWVSATASSERAIA